MTTSLKEIATSLPEEFLNAESLGVVAAHVAIAKGEVLEPQTFGMHDCGIGGVYCSCNIRRLPETVRGSIADDIYEFFDGVASVKSALERKVQL